MALQGLAAEALEEVTDQGGDALVNRRLCLVVLGMHRSGTSAFTRVLSIAGAKLPADLMGAAHGNDTGHWESDALVQYDDKLLAEFGSGWDDWSPLDYSRVPTSRRADMQADISDILRSQYGDAPLIVVKDPRICRFAPLFLEATERAGFESKCVLPIRSPLEVVQSLERRNQMPRGQAALLWLRHILDAEIATRNAPRALLDYSDLVADWPGALGQLKERLGIALPYGANEIRPQVDAFLSAEHRHHVATAEQVLFDPMLRDWIGEAYSALLVLKRNPASGPALETLDRVRREFNNAAPILRRMLDEVNELREAQIRHYQNEIFEAREQVSQAMQSADGLSRRLTALEAEAQAGASAILALAGARARIADVEAEYHAQASELAAATANVRALAEAKAEIDSALTDARAVLAAARDDAQLSQARIRDAEHRLEAVSSLKRRAEAELAERDAELERARRAIAAFQRNVDAARQEYDRQLSEKEVEISNLRLALAGRALDLEEELAGAKNAIAAYERRIAQYQVEAATLGARFGRLLTRWRTRLAPSSSWRARLVGHAMKVAERLYRYGPGKSAYTYLTAAREPTPDSESVVGAAAPSSTIVAASPPDYAAWIDACEPTPNELAAQRADADLASRGPLISIIVPVYKVPPDVLSGTLQSLSHQTYPNWEACIAYADIGNDENWALLEQFAARDPRIRPERLTENLGISGNSNAALKNARGEFIALLDHDDELTPWALHDMARAILADGEADFLYSDKDTVDQSGAIRINPLFKPEWSPEMLYSVNYLTHLNVMRRSVVDDIGGWRSETDGAQDWDLFLRVSERARKIVRVPGVHYHWRVLPTSVASGIEAKPYATAAQLRTIKDRVERLGLPAHVMPDPESGFRLSWRTPRAPDVDLVVQSPGAAAHTLAKLLREASHDFPAWVASVNVVQDADAPSEDWRGCFGDVPVRTFVSASADDRTARTLEAAASGAAAALVFVDGEFESISSGWIDELAGWILGHEDIGFVGSLLLTPNNEVIEAGRVVGASGTSAPLLSGTPLYHWGPIGGPLWFRNVSAVSPHVAACCRRLWPAPTPREAHLDWRDAFVARCEEIRRAGGRGMVSPYVRAVRARRESDSRQYWDDTFRDDPFFHPAFASVTPLRIGAAGA